MSSVTGTEAKYFYFGNGNTRRQVVGTKTTWVAGDSISWYGGRANITQASTVGWTNADNGTAFRRACAVGGTGGKGESGGPVFNGSAAAAFVSSLVSINGSLRVCFSHSRYMQQALGGVSIIGG
ncbi:MAG: hypothetical protein H0V73_06055 [Chloroflexi bacterium]|nr:hypothetical protein [Chloroflexota bacterium]